MMQATCKCGGSLIFNGKEKNYSIASDNKLTSFPMFIYECTECHTIYRIAKSKVDGIEIYDPDPNFLNGVDLANGKI